MAVELFVGCLTSQQHASVSQGQICSDKFTCCHTEIEFADQTFYLTQSQYTDTGPTSPSADPITPGAWQGSHWNANFEVTGMTRPRKKSRRKRDSNPGSSALEADALTTRPTRRCGSGSSLVLVRMVAEGTRPTRLLQRKLSLRHLNLPVTVVGDNLFAVFRTRTEDTQIGACLLLNVPATC